MAPIRAVTAALPRSARPFSLLSTLRQAGRGMEAHPFERLPAAQEPAPADYGKMVRRVASQAVGFFPGFALILGWPFAAKKICDGHM